MSEPDCMEAPYCCLTCSHKFKWGNCIMSGPDLICPKCRSNNLHPANGDIVELNEYHGEIGTRQ